jgi:hypothetical protein
VDIFIGKDYVAFYEGGERSAIIIKDNGAPLETRICYTDASGKKQLVRTELSEEAKAIYENAGIELTEIKLEDARGKEIERFYYAGALLFPYSYFNNLAKTHGNFVLKGLKTGKTGEFNFKFGSLKSAYSQNQNLELYFENGEISKIAFEGKNVMYPVLTFISANKNYKRIKVGFHNVHSAQNVLNNLEDGVIKDIVLDNYGKLPLNMAAHIEGLPGQKVDVEVQNGKIIRIIEADSPVSGQSALAKFLALIKPIAGAAVKAVSAEKEINFNIASGEVPVRVIDSIRKGGAEIVIADRNLGYAAVLDINTGIKILFSSNGARFTAEIGLKIYNIGGVNMPVLHISGVKGVGDSLAAPGSGYLNEAGSALIREIRDNHILQKEISSKLNLSAESLYSAAVSESALKAAETEIFANKTAVSVSGTDMREENALYLIGIMKMAGVGNIIVRGDTPEQQEQAKIAELFRANGINVVGDSFAEQALKIEADTGIADFAEIGKSNSFVIYFGEGVTVLPATLDSAMNIIKEKFVPQADDYYLRGLLLTDKQLQSVSQISEAKELYLNISGAVISQKPYNADELASLSNILEHFSPELASDILKSKNPEEAMLKAQQFLKGMLEKLLVIDFYRGNARGIKFSDKDEERLFGRLLFAQAIEEKLSGEAGGKEINLIMRALMPDTPVINWPELSGGQLKEFKNLLFNENTAESLSALLAVMKFLAGNEAGFAVFEEREQFEASAVKSFLKAA